MDRIGVIISKSNDPAIGDKQFEIVERKGIGHPDSICDGIVESVCNQLCRVYKDNFGRILHHNIDKGLLVAGRSNPRIGGGTIVEPMRFIFGDRATSEFQGVKIPISEIAQEAAGTWLKKNLRFINPEVHMLFQNEIRPGSSELVDNLLREEIGANDTSVGVGYAPLSPTEQVVLAVEKWLNSATFKQSFPECGEDIKIMGIRSMNRLQLIVAIAFVDLFIKTAQDYFDKKQFFQSEIKRYIASLQMPFTEVNVEINSLDNPAQGEAGMYLTVLGTSAESGDSGEVGRGNRVNGVISYNRPSTTEAAAGKNPVNHTGKIYNILSHRLAAKVYETVDGIQELTIWLCSRIGDPLGQPVVTSVEVKPLPGVHVHDLEGPITAIITDDLAHLELFMEQIQLGKFTVF
ncbi:MAG: methionine adenosyltransferase [Desulfuromonadales bacterium]|nr:methionine adenosyltransferase [Desulfuromonadales bacterium]